MWSPSGISLAPKLLFESGVKMKSVLREIAITLLMALVLFLGIHYTVQNTEVISGSMEPTLSIGERLFINKLAYKFGQTPQRGDIVVFVPPESLGSPLDYIKRIIGLPGEKVQIKDGTVTIIKADGTEFPLTEPYIAELPSYTYTSPVIPANNYFVMGDNRNNSGDSHLGYTVPLSDIVGKGLWVTWPFSKFGAAPNYKFSQ
jgi:signal peptidase I